MRNVSGDARRSRQSRLEVHSLAEDADHDHTPLDDTVEHDVRADGNLPAPGANMVASDAPARVLGDSLAGALNVAQVGLRFLNAELLDRIAPDVFNVLPRLRREFEAAHRALGAPLRLPSRKPSKSNGSGGPLSSPSTSAA